MVFQQASRFRKQDIQRDRGSSGVFLALESARSGLPLFIHILGDIMFMTNRNTCSIFYDQQSVSQGGYILVAGTIGVCTLCT